MITDTEIKAEGVRALVGALGDVQAEKFISLIMREQFDYTKWQKTLWPEQSLVAISRAAMNARRQGAKTKQSH
jgi:hypothetical protein